MQCQHAAVKLLLNMLWVMHFNGGYDAGHSLWEYASQKNSLSAHQHHREDMI